jgi:hypothetical protein
MPSRQRQLAVPTLAPALLLVAVGVVIVAQLWHVVPIAGAIALAAWGTALALPARRGYFLLTLLVYVPMVTIAIASQLDAASAGSLLRQFFVAMDAGAAGGLMVLLARRTSAPGSARD